MALTYLVVLKSTNNCSKKNYSYIIDRNNKNNNEAHLLFSLCDESSQQKKEIPNIKKIIIIMTY